MTKLSKTPKPLSDPEKFFERSTAAAKRDRLGIIRELATSAFAEDPTWSGFRIKGVASDHLTVIDEEGRTGHPGAPFILEFKQDQGGDVRFGELLGPGEFVFVPVPAKAAAAVEKIRVTTQSPGPEKTEAAEPPRDPFRVEVDSKKVAERDQAARAEAARQATPAQKPLSREHARELQRQINIGILHVPEHEQMRIQRALAGEKPEPDPFKLPTKADRADASQRDPDLETLRNLWYSQGKPKGITWQDWKAGRR